jgi:hypothetical protein
MPAAVFEDLKVKERSQANLKIKLKTLVLEEEKNPSKQEAAPSEDNKCETLHCVCFE